MKLAFAVSKCLGTEREKRALNYAGVIVSGEQEDLDDAFWDELVAENEPAVPQIDADEALIQEVVDDLMEVDEDELDRLIRDRFQS